MRLNNSVALITGGGSGIGLATARALAEEGARVSITGRRAETLREASASIHSEHPVDHHPADVSDRQQANQVVQRVLEECGRIDILVVNHGLNVARRGIEELAPEDWDRVLSVNATGVFNLVHAVLPGMRQRGDGVIVCTSSIAGCRPSTLGGVAYSASKHAATALIRTISEEERENGVRLTVVSPGEVNTPILDARPVPVSDEHKARILQPEDVAAAIVFVATLPPRAHIPDLVIKPTTQSFV